MHNAQSSDTPLTTMDAEWYDQLWRNAWMDQQRYGPTRRHVRNVVHALIEPLQFDSVMDVGCGGGVLLQEIRQLRPAVRVIGTDVSQTALEMTRQLVPDGSYALLDIERETLPERADLTICSEVLEHLHADEESIANLATMTRRYVVIVVPQGEMRRFERGDVGHVRNYTRASMCEKLERGGFTPLSVVEWGYPFFSPIYRNLLEFVPGGTVQKPMGWRQHLLAKVLYRIFAFNSWQRGDKLVVLASRNS